jgi:SAM-dependent methyltransferase
MVLPDFRLTRYRDRSPCHADAMSSDYINPAPLAASDRDQLRLTFGSDAELYDRMRPTYPTRMFDDLAQHAGIGPGCRVLEIGPGTGQATVPLAERGCRLIGVELSPSLAEIARSKTAQFAAVDIVTAAFEDWPLPNEPFDVVVSATAFHWIDPAVRVKKAADALRPDGVLATISTHHVSGGTAEFFIEVQNCYERWDPATTVGLRLPSTSEIAADSDELDRSGRFGPAIFHRYEWDAMYSTDDYRNLLLTYSVNIAMDPSDQNGLLDCIGDLMDLRYGGEITKRYLTELRVARRQ